MNSSKITPIKLLKKKGPPCIADKPDSFEGLVNGSTIVVDKSPFISHVFEAMRNRAVSTYREKSCSYIPLPPAMGKTCLLSMLKSFVDVSFREREDPDDVFATKFDEGYFIFCSLAINLAKHFHFFSPLIANAGVRSINLLMLGSRAIHHPPSFSLTSPTGRI